MRKLTAFGIKVTLLSAAVLCAAANAQTYQFADLGSLGGGYSTALAINNNGMIVGGSNVTAKGDITATEWNHLVGQALYSPLGFSTAYGVNDLGQVVGRAGAQAALWDQSGLTLFNGLSGQPTGSANSINKLGQVVGFSETNSYRPGTTTPTTHATLWSAGNAPVDLGTLGGSNSFAYAVNNGGQVVGVSNQAGDQSAPATLWQGGSARAIGGIYTVAYDINDPGQAVGYSFRGAVQTATLFDPTGGLVDLDPLGSFGSVAKAINKAGMVVGYSNTDGSGFSTSGTLWSAGTAIDLNGFLDPALSAAGWYIQTANDINDAGWIVGDIVNSVTGDRHGYLLSVAAVPEPSTYGLMICGGALMLWSRRRRARASSNT